jgi:hypothetical protein
MNGINRYHQHTQLKSRLSRLGLLSIFLLAISGCASGNSPITGGKIYKYSAKAFAASCYSYVHDKDIEGCEPKLNEALAYFDRYLEGMFSLKNASADDVRDTLVALIGRAKVKQKLNDPAGAFGDYAGAIYIQKSIVEDFKNNDDWRMHWRGTERIGQMYQQQAVFKRQLNDPQGAKEAEDKARVFFDEAAQLKEVAAQRDIMLAEKMKRDVEALRIKQAEEEKERQKQKEIERERHIAYQKWLVSPERKKLLEQQEREQANQAPGFWERAAEQSNKRLEEMRARDNARRDADYRNQNNCSGGHCNNR